MQKAVRLARSTVGRASAGALALVGSSTAMAATATPIDTTLAVAQLGEIDTGLVAIGGAIIALAALAVGFKWIKGMIFG